jgi:xanthine dehydrogenase iron-sulfur cluster and FAD-binding subunit A
VFLTAKAQAALVGQGLNQATLATAIATLEGETTPSAAQATERRTRRG